MKPLRDDVAVRRPRHAAPPTRRRPPANRRGTQRGLIAVVGVALMALIVAAGVVVGFHLTSQRSTMAAAPQTTRFSATLPNSPGAQTPVAAPAPKSDARTLESDFAELQAAMPATIGIALAPVGAPQPPVLLGEWSGGPAWSTMKVPLAIAALRAEDPPQVTTHMKAAITQSDNAAADVLWRSLGDPEAAAGKVDAVLQEAGDPTKVQYQRIRPQFSAFGQTDWSLADQTRFLAAAACDNRNEPIINLMGEIAGDEQWGLGIIADTRYKGGWGPSETGAYLVRQLGLLPIDSGQAVVAMAVQPHSGQFSDGTAELTQIAEWLRDHAATLPAGRCAA
ncbi:hypothetical protein [Mycobacterium sp. MMS18-G62]